MNRPRINSAPDLGTTLSPAGPEYFQYCIVTEMSTGKTKLHLKAVNWECNNSGFPQRDSLYEILVKTRIATLDTD